MSEVAARLACEIPKRMRTRPKDRRGYPVPFIVMIDKTGRPQFTINDTTKVRLCIAKRRCGHCGKRLDDGVWFVGGSMSFTSPHGAFIDPGNHEDCARYALRTCPFLAAPSYSKPLNDKLLAPGAIPDGVTIAVDPLATIDRPPLFMLGQTPDYGTTPSLVPGQVYLKAKGWTRLEYWRQGRQLPDAEGRALAQARTA